MATTTNLVNLFNMALIRIGRDTISSLSEATVEAQKCSIISDEIRMQILTEGPWSFAVKRAELGQLSSTPKFEFDYQHQLPNDFLVLLEINETTSGTYDHRVEGNKILSNITDMKIRYIADEDDETKWSASFKTAFVDRAAAELSYLFRADKNLTQMLFEKYERSVMKGLAIDGKNGANEKIVSPDLHEVR